VIDLRILVVEDAVKLAGLLKRGLEEEGYAVDLVSSGLEAVWIATENDYDAIVLDVVLGDIDGFEVCTRLRNLGRWSPVLMLTARDGVDDRVRGLDSGADDYLTKPFAFRELVARVRALLRRGGAARPTVLAVGDLLLDPARRDVRRGNRTIELTAKEFSLLEYLMRHTDEVLSRTNLIEHVWDFAFDGNPHVVSVYIGYLRDKIDKPFRRRTIETVRGIGYRIRDDRDAAASN
jgi:two-component system OmpR family response regulator